MKRGRLRSVKVVIGAALLVLAMISCAEKKVAKREFVIAESKSYEASLYRQNCAICHGVEGNGKTVDGKPVPSLRYGDAAKRTEAEIRQQIAFGKLPMPSFKGHLTDEEIEKMVKFVMRDLQGREN
jgi:mono/diheme cytochrome c family protein